jgi:hypothetical protein
VLCALQLYRKGTFDALGTIHNVNQPYGACMHESFLYMCCMGISAVTVYRPSYLDPSPHAHKQPEIEPHAVVENPPMHDIGDYGDY